MKQGSKAQETLQYGIDECNKLLDKPDSQLTDTDGTDCIKQMISDEAFEEWFDKAWGTAEMGISKHAALQDAFTAGFKAGQEHNEQVVEGFKGRIDYWSNRDIENRAQIKQLTDENEKLKDISRDEKIQLLFDMKDKEIAELKKENEDLKDAL